MPVAIKRVYEPAAAEDGHRYLVDRLWPRGISKNAARLDAWLRDIAPSDELRQRYHHEPTLFTEFQRRYRAELERRPREIETLVDQARESRVTLVFAARDPVHSNAAVLRDVILERIDSTRRSGRGRPGRPRAPST